MTQTCVVLRMLQKTGYVYIMSNKTRTTFYVGMTNDIYRRVHEHKPKTPDSFTKRYNLFVCLYYEKFDFIKLAFLREQQLKRWHRDWKINLIKSVNPEMKDLSEGWFNS